MLELDRIFGLLREQQADLATIHDITNISVM
jgi:hypothetical protein